jgi:hypothetical protein
VGMSEYSACAAARGATAVQSNVSTHHPGRWANDGTSPDAEVTLCPKINVLCNLIIATTRTNAEGIAVFPEVQEATAGYARIIGTPSDATVADPFVAVFYYLNPPIMFDQQINVPVPRRSTRQLLSLGIGAEQLPDRGLLLINTFDCQNRSAAGVLYQSNGADELTTRFTVFKQLPTTESPVTDFSGYGGFVNMPTGTMDVWGDVPATGVSLERFSLNVRPDVITQTRFVPSGTPPPVP